MNRDELIERMLDAYDEKGDSWRSYCKDDQRRFRTLMAAALDVVLGEVLEPPLFHRQGSSAIELINDDLKARRARYSKVKTAEERVTIVDRGGTVEPPFFQVQLDGAYHFNCSDRKHCEIYRLGLIAKLKEGK